MVSNTLHELGQQHGTDKWDEAHQFKGVSYLHHYEQCFTGLRDQPINLLEIGVKDGESLRMWRDYFPKGQIFGIDIDPECRQHEGERIQIAIGSQNSFATIKEVARAAGGSHRQKEVFDIVIDDGSHINRLSLASFELLFPHVRPSGWYIIEDLRCSYQDARASWPGMKLNQCSLANDRREIEDWFLPIIHSIDRRQGWVHAIHFWTGMIALQKIPGGTPCGI